MKRQRCCLKCRKLWSDILPAVALLTAQYCTFTCSRSLDFDAKTARNRSNYTACVKLNLAYDTTNKCQQSSSCHWCSQWKKDWSRNSENRTSNNLDSPTAAVTDVVNVRTSGWGQSACFIQLSTPHEIAIAGSCCSFELFSVCSCTCAPQQPST